MNSFGTDPHIIRRNDGVDTSEMAAHSVDTAKGEALVYDIILSKGLEGCILDEVKHEYRARAGLESQFVNRRTGLHQKGLVLRQHLRRKGSSNSLQYVYVARELLAPEWVQWMKENYGWLNPCLFSAGEEVPLDPNSVEALVSDLVDELIAANRSAMIEGGVLTSSIGEPYDSQDSVLGRACKYLKKPIPLIEGW